MKRSISIARKASIFLAILLFSTASLAEMVVSGTITRLQNYEGHNGTLFVLSNMATTNGYCARNDWYILPLAHKYFDQDYALLLAAKIANRPVSVVLEIGDCVQGLPRIRHVYID